MIKIRISYSDEEEKDKVIQGIRDKFKLKKLSKEYYRGKYKEIHISGELKKD